MKIQSEDPLTRELSLNPDNIKLIETMRAFWDESKIPKDERNLVGCLLDEAEDPLSEIVEKFEVKREVGADVYSEGAGFTFGSHLALQRLLGVFETKGEMTPSEVYVRNQIKRRLEENLEDWPEENQKVSRRCQRFGAIEAIERPPGSVRIPGSEEKLTTREASDLAIRLIKYQQSKEWTPDKFRRYLTENPPPRPVMDWLENYYYEEWGLE